MASKFGLGVGAPRGAGVNVSAVESGGGGNPRQGGFVAPAARRRAASVEGGSLFLANTLEMGISKLAENDVAYTKVSFKRLGILDEGAMQLAEAMRNNNSVTKIDLSNNHITDVGAHVLADSLRADLPLQEIDMSENELSVGFCRELGEFLSHHHSITSVRAGSGIDCRGCGLIGHALTTNASLTTLDLCHNKIQDAGASKIWEALKTNKTLQNVNLSWNAIGDASCVQLAGALRTNTTLKFIDLQYNKITNVGACYAIVAVECNPDATLVEITMHHCNVKMATHDQLSMVVRLLEINRQKKIQEAEMAKEQRRLDAIRMQLDD